MRAIALSSKTQNTYKKFVKNNSTIIAARNWTSPGWRGEPGTKQQKKMSKLLNEQYNSVFNTPDPTMTIKLPKDLFGHPQSDINITREDIIDAIKTMSQNSFGGPGEFPAILLTLSF